MYKINKKLWLGLLTVFTVLLWLTAFSFPDQKLHLIFCDVGQGDATLIRQGFTEILIDGGPNDKVLTCLSHNLPFFDRTIEIVALTHPEADHLTGLISVLEKYKVNYFLIGPEGNNSGTYQTLLTRLRQGYGGQANIKKGQEMQIVNVYTGERIKMGEIELDSWWPDKEWLAEKVELDDGQVLGAKTEHKKLNDFSLVFLLKYKDLTALLMGDADSAIQDEISKSNDLIPIDILKFPHHGSKTGMREDFLAAIQPKEAVISVGKNSYGHPTSEALELLKKYNVKIRRTDLEGEIHYQF